MKNNQFDFDFEADVLDLLSDTINTGSNTKFDNFVSTSMNEISSNLLYCPQMPIMINNFSILSNGSFVVSIEENKINDSMVLSIPDSLDYAQMKMAISEHFTPLQPVNLPGNLYSLNELTKSLVKKKPCIAKKVASAKRERVGGKFKQCTTKWVSATDFLKVQSSLPPKQT
mmetsp:Transcript_1052/g.1383  ORF Transcript_1052/g.1383 Transcript_1052/m.1383 type:complete len:171 (-) Transcript_1052:2940-3452(-)